MRNSLESFFLWEVTWGTKQETLKTVLAAHQQCGWHPKHLKRSAAAPGRCFTPTYQNAVVTSYCRLRLLCTFAINLTPTQWTPTHSVVTNPSVLGLCFNDADESNLKHKSNQWDSCPWEPEERLAKVESRRRIDIDSAFVFTFVLPYFFQASLCV